MLHWFLLEFRSGENAGYSIRQPILKPIFIKYSSIFLSTCDGVLSCMNIIFWLMPDAYFCTLCVVLFFINSITAPAVNFTPSGTHQGPTVIPAQNITPPLLCWHLGLVPSIRSIKSCLALISEQCSLEIHLHFYLDPFVMHHIVDGLQWKSNIWLDTFCKVAECPACRRSWNVPGTSLVKYIFAVG